MAFNESAAAIRFQPTNIMHQTAHPLHLRDQLSRLHHAPPVRCLSLLLAALLLSACAPSPTLNVLGYEIKQRLGTLTPSAPPTHATGQLHGRVVDRVGNPIAHATALVATPTGTPYTAQTNAAGEYTIRDVPPGQYVPAFVAPDYTETSLQDRLGIPRLVTVASATTTLVPAVTLHPYQSPPLPNPWPDSVALEMTHPDPQGYTAQASFPPGAQARVYTYRFVHQQHIIESLRLYLPLDTSPNQPLPLMFMIYPTDTAAWEEVSIAYAAEGFAFVAISPAGGHGLDIDAHAQDMRVAFHLARDGHLHATIDPQRIVTLGGSFSSTILHRFLRDEVGNVRAWVNVGGITNAFTGATEFYRGELEMPPDFEYAIPALGPANIYPLPFLRFAPVYTAAWLPPTFIVHTAADRIATIDQAYQLEAALREAQIPVETYYYADTSHYLMIGDAITQSSMDVYYAILDYVDSRLEVTRPPR